MGRTAPVMPGARRILGVDFTSSPRPGKPITVAICLEAGRALRLQRLEALPSMAAFEAFLGRPGPWLAGFDCPFGLPGEFVDAQGWKGGWASVVASVAALTRAELKDRCRAYCDARPPGLKFAHRETDRPAGSSPSMKWVNPPVAIMLHAAAPLLKSSGVCLPAHGMAGDPARIAIEAYPGYLARQITRDSYKSDDRARQTPARRAARERIIDSVTREDCPAGLRAVIPENLRRAMAGDASGDLLDALLCALQAAAAANLPGFGVPFGIDPREGWIASVPRGTPKDVP